MSKHPLTQARAWTLHTPHDALPYVTVMCATCSTTYDLRCQVNHPPHLIANKMRDRGWHIAGEGRKARCPDCLAKKRSTFATSVLDPAIAQALATKIDPQPAPETTPMTNKAKAAKLDTHLSDPLYKQARAAVLDIATTHSLTKIAESTELSAGTLYRLQAGVRVTRARTLAAVISVLGGLKRNGAQPGSAVAAPKPYVSVMDAPGRTPSALKQQRTLFTLLEEHYVESAKRYDTGWDDARVAAECGLSVKYVAATREAGFGPVGDAKLDAIAARIEAAEAKLVTERDELSRLVVATLADINAELKACRAELSKLRKESAV